MFRRQEVSILMLSEDSKAAGKERDVYKPRQIEGPQALHAAPVKAATVAVIVVARAKQKSAFPRFQCRHKLRFEVKQQ